MFSKFFRRNASADAAAKAYQEIVRQSRLPVFYTRFGVPDTLDGRFDLLVLHTALVLIRLKGEKGESEAFSQALFDTLFTDMDQSLREIGVSDISIGKKVKEMGRAFYGRLEAYEAALQAPETDRGEELGGALLRNLYRGESAAEAHSGAMAAYVIALAAHLGEQTQERITGGDIGFLAP
ncbi:ubiquinol-cytochrome C chaperone family protein [Nisaea sediminum]|uniref:ubiquinol-cytochrome C chaperone family protein n=1 Tax=Nisaea sediminum TaxID=2775867 RepID=UPI0029C050AE|nr:ubiquinol-cytochrome C chaperone family protein [Nisaea sediminum]